MDILCLRWSAFIRFVRVAERAFTVLSESKHSAILDTYPADFTKASCSSSSRVLQSEKRFSPPLAVRRIAVINCPTSTECVEIGLMK